MLFSLSMNFLLGMIFGGIFARLRLPSLLGMLLTGMLLGPYGLNLLSPEILMISADLRRIALIIILTRAGLNLDLSELKKVGRPAVLMCFLPASFEIAGMLLLAPGLLGISILEAAVLGAVIAAVSPAVVVPRMLRLMEEKRGTAHGIPQLIMAGASVDDVFVIVLFTCFTGLLTGGTFSPADLLKIPTSVVSGAVCGLAFGAAAAAFFKAVHLRDSLKVLILLSVSFLFVTLEDAMDGIIGFSGLLAVMAMGASLKKFRRPVAERLSLKYSKLWVAAELLLFVLVGAAADLPYALSAGPAVVAAIFGALLFRMAGVFLSLAGTRLTKKERLFCMIAYTPKATVQAAIGSVPLSMGLSCGNIVLTAAVAAILLTAPLGAFLTDVSSRKLLGSR